VSFNDLDQGQEMTIFVSILTTFIASTAGAVVKIDLSLKSNHLSKFILPKLVKHTVSRDITFTVLFFVVF
jgi:hypothetical protein